MARLRLAVIGVGHLGKEHARILAATPGVELVGVADARPEQAEAVAGRCNRSSSPAAGSARSRAVRWTSASSSTS